MLGIVFTEFLEMVEARFSEAMADRLVEETAPPSGGAYTAVGNYPPEEMMALIGQLSQLTGQPAPQLVEAFGRHLFQRFSVLYPALFVGVPSSFAFMEQIENRIHVEVRKLYPDAELPRFDCARRGSDTLILDYRSTRPLGRLARGLIEGCANHFGETVEVTEEDYSVGGDTRIRFIVTRRPG